MSVMMHVFGRTRALPRSLRAGLLSSKTQFRTPLQAQGCGARYFSDLPEHIVLTMPALSPTMERGTIAEWNLAEGDAVGAGDSMAEVETDKATVAFESVEEGFLARIIGETGVEMEVGTPVAILVEEEEDIAAFKDYVVVSDAPAADAAPAEAEPAPAAAAPAPAVAVAPAPAAVAVPVPSGERVVASPLARTLAAEKGIDIAAVAGTGPNRRIIGADVREYTPAAVAAAVPAVAPAAPAAAAVDPMGLYEDMDVSQMRKVIAQRLTESKTTVPHYYLSLDCKMDALLALRAQLNAKAGDDGVRISVNDFIIKATAIACKKVPDANSAWLGDKIRQHNYVDVSVAVSTPSGLITPIVKDADLKGLASISSDVRSLAGKAREGTLQPDEFMGGTVTISNLGMFGIKGFNAIVNPPQALILAVGTTETRVVVNENDESGETPFTTAQYMNVSVSADHRVLDGAVGAQWLKVFQGLIEDPTTMLL